ncbi:hypothetical protein [Streptomyces decoyicus]|uniref:hypothetical protein n=1 Tax=Streptomyces decoyicus TaxID=249567 RepID=UPI003667D520
MTTQDPHAVPGADAWVRQFTIPDAQPEPDRTPAELTPGQVLAEVRDALAPDGWIATALQKVNRPLRRHQLPAQHTADLYVSSLVAVAAGLGSASKSATSDRTPLARFAAAEFDLTIAAHTLETALNFASRASELPCSDRKLLGLIEPCYASVAVHLRLAADTLAGRYPLRHTTPA